MKFSMDKEKFSELFSKFTGIEKGKIDDYLVSGKVNELFQNPRVVTDDLDSIRKVDELKLLRNTYDNLKDYDRQYTITSPSSAAKFFLNHNMDIQDKEYFSVAYLDTKNNIIDTTTKSGSIDAALVFKREVIKDAFKYNASSIILSHNHPSGSPQPSPQDLGLTGDIYTACKAVGLSMLDHVITANMKHYSIKENYPDLDSLGSNNIVFEDKGKYETPKKSIKDKLNDAMKKSQESKGLKEPVKESKIER